MSEATLLLTAREPARALRLSRSKVYELIGSGRLPSVQIGAARRISVAALETYVAQLEEEARFGEPESPTNDATQQRQEGVAP